MKFAKLVAVTNQSYSSMATINALTVNASLMVIAARAKPINKRRLQF